MILGMSFFLDAGVYLYLIVVLALIQVLINLAIYYFSKTMF